MEHVLGGMTLKGCVSRLVLSLSLPTFSLPEVSGSSHHLCLMVMLDFRPKEINHGVMIETSEIMSQNKLFIDIFQAF